MSLPPPPLSFIVAASHYTHKLSFCLTVYIHYNVVWFNYIQCSGAPAFKHIPYIYLYYICQMYVQEYGGQIVFKLQFDLFGFSRIQLVAEPICSWMKITMVTNTHTHTHTYTHIYPKTKPLFRTYVSSLNTSLCRLEGTADHQHSLVNYYWVSY